MATHLHLSGGPMSNDNTGEGRPFGRLGPEFGGRPPEQETPGATPSWPGAPSDPPTQGFAPLRAMADDADSVIYRSASAPPRRVAEELSHQPVAAPKPLPKATPPTAYAGPGFGGALGWTFLGTVVPGVGLIRAGRKAAGFVALGIFLVLAGLVAYAAVDRRAALGAAVTPSVLLVAAVALVVGALVVAMLISATYLALRPDQLTTGKRIVGSAFVALLVFGMTAPMAVAATYSYQQATLIKTVFAQEESLTRPTIVPGSKEDPWKDTPRINLLLIGGDDSAERNYGNQTNTDTMILASIDTHTGNTVLVSVPRNTARIPFPKDSPLYKYFPSGYWDGVSGENQGSWANGIWSNISGQVPKDIQKGTTNFGADALKLGIGEALGVKLDYYVYVNIDGLYTLIDALGGITVNVNSRIPMAGNSEGKPPTGYIQPGPDRKLDAYQAMWYARSRSASDDFDRMGRQRCVINAIIKKADPATMLTKYEALAKAGSKMVKTDIPAEVLPMMVELALRVKNASITSMQFTNGMDGFISANPNFSAMRQQVAAAIAESVAVPSAQPTGSAAPQTTAAPPPASSAKSTAATKKTSTAASAPSNPAVNVTDACAYVGPSASASTKK